MGYESINVTNISVLDNPASFKDNFKFEITFESAKELKEDLEWKLTYVGSVDSESYDQVLDSILVGPVPKGVSRFIFETPCADWTKLPKKDILGVTVLFLSCLFEEKEFIRIGYYINNEYEDPDSKFLKSDIVDQQQDVIVIEDEEEEEDEEDDDEEEEEEEIETNIKEPTAKKLKLDKSLLHENAIKTEGVSKEVDPEVTVPKAKENANISNISKVDAKDDTLEKQKTVEVPFPVNFTIDKVKRHIFEDKPRITHIQV